ncbi:hypothetical protein JCGZ_10545 [Jatropha curcas]|uniref:Uncharacterized protein n=1 Tax=Jatropha curcas TaxID=180498 RepID=A0A067KR77_JATCU|nr:hypothetical protein JCGZ_10545 [Jatropha curcas]
MAIDPTEHLNMEGQDNTHGEANQQPLFALLPTTDPQVAAALAQAYSQLTIVLKRLLENPQPAGEPISPTGPAKPPYQEHSLPLTSPKYRSHSVSNRYHEAELEVDPSATIPNSQELSHTQLLLDRVNL